MWKPKERILNALNALSEYFDGDRVEQTGIDVRLDRLRQEIRKLPDNDPTKTRKDFFKKPKSK
jgi:hypothetical protein